jgi:hypothetical protein
VRSDCLTSCCPGLQEVSLANTHLLNIQDFYALVQLGMRGFIPDNFTGKFTLVLVKRILGQNIVSNFETKLLLYI